MTILDIKMQTLLSFVAVKYGGIARFEQDNEGYGRLVVDAPNGDGDATILSWTNDNDRRVKILKYIFLNKV